MNGYAKSNIVRERFEYEAQSIEAIRNNLRSEQNPDRDIPLIQPIGWTDKFHESDAYRILTEKKIFQKFGLDVSSFAMVTKLYDGTLKDLLEGSAPDSSDNRSNGRTISGYKVLASLDFATRIRTIKPFLNKVAEGLTELHKATKCHLDLKPANIYYKCSANEFDVVIGDLGFIGQPQLAGTATSPDEIALGTRHYRSPEQKDFSDSCEASVITASNGPKKISSYRVIVTDPKFSDSIIEPGDALVFSKDVKRNEHIISAIDWDEGNKQATISFSSKYDMEEDQNTQVVMYKRQSTRTDIFGFGALLYDMITCGRSPERFYDYLRADDSYDKTVSTIREKYRQVSTFSAKDPNYVSTFSSFRHENGQEYAPLEIVELILECMLYQAEGTLFNKYVEKPDNTSKTHWKAAKAALSRLNELENKYPSIRIKSQNPLLTSLKNPSTASSTDEIGAELRELQKAGVAELKNRVGHATIRYRQLISLVQQITQGKKFYLAEMSPENIFLGNENSEKPGFSITTYQNSEEYEKGLLEDIVYTKVFYNPSNPYSHESLGHLRRKITLKPTNISDNETQKNYVIKGQGTSTWSYVFDDSSPLGDVINDNDWIVLGGVQPNQLFRVKCTSSVNIITIQPISISKNSTDNEEKDIKVLEEKKAVYYRNINTIDYYLGSLGIYLYQSFFVGLGSNTISEPSIIQRYKSQLLDNPDDLTQIYKRLKQIISQNVYKKKGKNNDLVLGLYRRITAFYIALSLPTPSRFFLNDQSNSAINADRILDNLFGQWYQLNSDIEKCLDFTPGFLTSSDNIHRIDAGGSWELNDDQLNIINLLNDILRKDNTLSNIRNWATRFTFLS